MQLSAASTAEQASVGLDRLPPDEYARFQALNARYRERFGFPFVIAVRNRTPASILAAFERRLDHAPAAEVATALQEIGEIARWRLREMIG